VTCEVCSGRTSASSLKWSRRSSVDMLVIGYSYRAESGLSLGWIGRMRMFVDDTSASDTETLGSSCECELL
jgi:hypothetical protein